LALIASRADAYPPEAVKEMERILKERAKDEQRVYFTLRQPDEEADRVRVKAAMQAMISTLNLQPVCPRLKRGHIEVHAAAPKLLLEEAAEQPTAPVYRKNDILLYDQWSPRNMDRTTKVMYQQTVEITEPQLHQLRTWIYRQYGQNVTPLQICVIMICWQIAKTADEAFFMMRWISAWSELSWMNLRSNLRSVPMPPRLAGVDAQPLVIPFEVPLKLRDASGKLMGEYTMQESGDPQLYPGTFAVAAECQTMVPVVLTRQ
ncbi:MAG: hypothetical protein GY835_08835, partial [bacterium]|nr:hypothetical protein [bacterium]